MIISVELGATVELIALIGCVVTAWIAATIVNALPGLGTLFVPSPWLVGGVVLVLVIWLMRDQPA
ncbi:hypothetical protein IQ254_01055 [Nodosilinea sp. LEGE 07088]|uniref:hypothetical protein n=1 Tax=Nodosilinea sp. LEGE 07088 TaxID=2777968 RepID=UPI001880047C|nr:hypothetical protein [Nodosilinea sp. LEGE 07088]MBE9135805.1 hypothetical protein [Nodosilinea sp. LEGE 07088]